MKCESCESTNLVAGQLTDAAGRTIVFQLANEPVLKRIFGVGQRPLTTVACLHCGAMQVRVEFTEEDRREFATYEGDPPSVVDVDPD